MADIKRILVADDDELIRGLIQQTLENEGYCVDVVSTGKALYQLANLPYAVIITDYLMPEWDGLEAIELAQTLGSTSPVIFVTGYADANLKNYPVLQKPFGLKELIELVNEVQKKKEKES